MTRERLEVSMRISRCVTYVYLLTNQKQSVKVKESNKHGHLIRQIERPKTLSETMKLLIIKGILTVYTGCNFDRYRCVIVKSLEFTMNSKSYLV